MSWLILAVALTSAAMAEGPVRRVESLLEQMREAEDEDAEVVLRHGREALEALTGNHHDELEARVLNRMAQATRNKGDHAAALDLAERARAAAERAGARPELADALMSVAVMHFSLGSFAAASDSAGAARAVFEELGDDSGVARVLNLEGVLKRHRGDYDRALELLLEALEIEERLGSESGIRRALTNIGLVHWNLRQCDRALEFYSRILEMPEANNPRGLATLYNNVGLCHWELDDHDQALEYYTKALDIRRELNDRNGLALLHNNIGLVYRDLGDEDRALEHYEEALAIAEAIGRKEHAANTLNNAAEIYLEQGELDRALRYVERSLATTEELPAKKLTRNSHRLLSRIHETRGDAGRALVDYKKYTELELSIFNEERDGRIAEMQARYESERKEKEIEILKQAGAIRELELDRQRWIRNVLMAGFVLLFAWIALLYNRYRLREASNRIIARKNEELERALEEIQTLSGLLPICTRCKSIRDDQGSWQHLETYISQRSPAKFSHGLCPHCLEAYVAERAESTPVAV